MGRIRFIFSGELSTTKRDNSLGWSYEMRYILGSGSQLELFEVKYGAGAIIEPHAHEEDEIIYILGGSLIAGHRECFSGTAISVPARTLYGFRAGEAGLHFLNFRPRASERRVISKEELIRERGPWVPQAKDDDRFECS